MDKYQGHKNWNHWNVSLWINNDYGLYKMAKEYIKQYRGKPLASIRMYAALKDYGATRTSDGALYSVSAIRAAMVGM